MTTPKKKYVNKQREEAKELGKWLRKREPEYQKYLKGAAKKCSST